MSNPLDVFQAPLSGISLVEASAGTGKTYNITSLYVRAILEMGLKPADILVMTYTEAATAELKFRLRNRLKESLKAVQKQNSGNDAFLTDLLKQSYNNAESKLKTAIETFDDASVFTIHGFCSRLLTEYSLQFDVSPDFELLTDYTEFLQDCVDDYWRSLVRNAGEDQNQRVLLDYLTDDGFGPDELKSTLEYILTHPYAKIEPSDISIGELFGLIPELESKFQRIKGLWEKEGKKLNEIYNSGHLKKNIYTAKTHAQDWEILLDWLSRTEFQIDYSERLEKFGLKITRSGLKSAPDIPVLNLCKAIDEYRETADKLKLLKPAFIKESIQEIRDTFQLRKSDSNLLSYNDLLEIVEQVLKSDESGYLKTILSKKYPLALVDEFQDTDQIQYGIFREIYGDKKDNALFMIGDPKQAIYGFRGADIFTYLSAQSDVDDNQSYTLGENYRSNEKMIKGVNEFFSQSNSPFQIDKLWFNPVAFPPQNKDDEYILAPSGNPIIPFQTIKIEDESASNKSDFDDLIYDAVTGEITELLTGEYTIKGNEIREKDIAILVRSGYQGEEMQARLRAKGLKSVLKSRTSVFQVRESDELFLVLKAVQNIHSESGIRAALAAEMMGYNAQHIHELLQDESKWSAIIEKFIQLKETWDNKGIDAAIEELFSRFECLKVLAEKQDAERRITNLMHLAELLDKTERQERLYGKALLKWFYQKRNQEGKETEDEQLRLESDERLIQISTIHAAKGLQYQIVFCPFLWNPAKKIKSGDVFSFYHEGDIHIDISQNIGHSKKENFKKLSQEQQLAEEVRLAYVALTRAVSACYLFIPDVKGIKTSAIASILGGYQSGTKYDYDKIWEVLSACTFIETRNQVYAKPTDFRFEDDEKRTKLKVKEFSRNDLFRFPRMLSYSSLSEGREHAENAQDYDSEYEFREQTSISYNKYGFPKGATAGTCLHKIFEDISFDNPENLTEVVSQNLEYFGFSEQWKQPVGKWVRSVLAHSLNESGITLSVLEEPEVLKEMEFFFPVHQIKTDALWKLIRAESPAADSESIFGFMKGFIDLTFKYKNRFYILDYKSNYLGDDLEDYSVTNLKEAMIDAGYDLQYHIYTLALHRYLKERMQGYDYEQHFGGVMYVFLRGVEENKAGSGVFFDKPESSIIQEMDQYFWEGGAG